MFVFGLFFGVLFLLATHQLGKVEDALGNCHVDLRSTVTLLDCFLDIETLAPTTQFCLTLEVLIAT